MYLSNDDVDFAAYAAITDNDHKIKPAKIWIDELEEELINPPVDRSVLMPWASTGDSFAFRPGEVTIWAGGNGGGKSLMTGQVALGLVKQNQKVCIASFEMKPKVSLKRMVRQFAGKSLESTNYSQSPDAQKRDAFARFKQFAEGKLYFYDQQGTVNSEMIEAMCWHCATKLGITHIFIDSLMKCVSGEDNYNGQKDFIDKITAIARDNDIHISLVHHIRKLGSEEVMPSKNDLRGSSAIADQVDNVLMLWRNKKKENDMQRGMPIDPNTPDAYLMCVKQRNGEAEPWFEFFYHGDSQQFLDRQGGLPMAFDAKGDF